MPIDEKHTYSKRMSQEAMIAYAMGAELQRNLF